LSAAISHSFAAFGIARFIVTDDIVIDRRDASVAKKQVLDRDGAIMHQLARADGSVQILDTKPNEARNDHRCYHQRRHDGYVKFPMGVGVCHTTVSEGSNNEGCRSHLNASRRSSN
jgi:hypothetical protein